MSDDQLDVTAEVITKTTRMMAPEDLVLHPQNPRRGDVDGIRESIRCAAGSRGPAGKAAAAPSEPPGKITTQI